MLDVALWTLLDGMAVALMLLLEKAFEARHEYGGFMYSLAQVLEHRDIHYVWANTICLSYALLFFNALTVLRRHLGKGGWAQRFLYTPSNPSTGDQAKQ